MARAHWHHKVLAESDSTVRVEGNHYFPPHDVDRTLLRDSDHRTTCPWKGEAHYYDVVLDGDVNERAAWYYPEPKPAASNIRNHIAFWRGVTVED